MCEQVAPDFPREAVRKGLSGTVKAKITILQGEITEIVILSGPEIFHQAVIAAIKQTNCPKETSLTFTQDFTFRI
jgi:protein TonB